MRRRKGHYVYEKVPKTKAYFDKRDVKKYGLYSDKTRQYGYFDLDNPDARDNAKIYFRNEFMISRYVPDGIDFTPSIWGLVVAVLFLLGLCFLFKGLSDSSSLFDTSLSLADIVCDYGKSFKDEVVSLSKTFNNVKVDKVTFASFLGKGLESQVLKLFGVNLLSKIGAVLGFLVGFVYNFIVFIVKILVLIFA